MSYTIAAHGVSKINAAFTSFNSNGRPYACVELSIVQKAFGYDDTVHLPLYFDNIEAARSYADAINAVNEAQVILAEAAE